MAFVQATMPNYQTNWHHEVIAGALQRVAYGQCKRLIVTCPPRHGKSQLISMHLPAFMFGINPRTQIIAASYNATLAQKMNRAVQRIMDSPAYGEIFPGTKLNASNVRNMAAGNWLRNSDEFEIVGHGGLYRSAGVGGSATGYGMTLGLCDDPTRNRADASSPTYQQRLMDWFQSTFFTRLEKDGALIIVLTRWSERDLAGQLLELAKNNEEADQWEVVNLPAIAEEERHPEDHRLPGEALWPDKYNLSRLNKIAATIGQREFVSLYQQRPAPAEGALIKAGHIQWYDTLPDELSDWCISADLTFEDREDYAAFGVFARRGGSFYIVDMIEQRMDFTSQVAMFRSLCAQYPKATTKLVEKSANGAALINTLHQRISGIVPIQPRGSKENRLAAVSPIFEAGNFHVPRKAPWADKYVLQLTTFPAAAHDDMVDSTSQFLNYAQQRAAAVQKLTGLSQPRKAPARWR